MTLRLHGHAAYDKGDYVPAERCEEWRRRDPVARARGKNCWKCAACRRRPWRRSSGRSTKKSARPSAAAMAVGRPDPSNNRMAVFAESQPPTVKPYRTPRVKNGEAVGRALDYLLENNPEAFLFGLDVGIYGSAFKTCKGLIERHGPERVLDMPICESALVGFALGRVAGGRPADLRVPVRRFFDRSRHADSA